MQKAITRAERLLPGKPDPEGRSDRRWEAIIDLSSFIETEPEAVWEFILRWGKHPQADLRTAIGCCMLEHLLEYHFATYFPRVRETALSSPRFAGTFRMCYAFGQSELPKNSAKFRRLKEQLFCLRQRSRRT